MFGVVSAHGEDRLPSVPPWRVGKWGRHLAARAVYLTFFQLPTRARSDLVHLFTRAFCIPQHLRNLVPPSDCFSRIMSVLEGVLVTLWGAWGHPAMHSATAVRHRWRPAPAPAPCPGSASRAVLVHGNLLRM